jgi:zinc protease
MKIRTNFLWVISIVIIGIIACTPKVSEVSSKSKKISERKIDIQPHETHASANGIDDDVILLNNSIPVDPSIKTGVLKNGMRYFIKKNQKPENRVELRLALKAGSIHEDDDQKGLAHFIEHMEFNGSEHFTGNQLITILKKWVQNLVLTLMHTQVLTKLSICFK